MLKLKLKLIRWSTIYRHARKLHVSGDKLKHTDIVTQS